MKWVAYTAAAVVSAWAINASAATMIDDLTISYADGTSFSGSIHYDPSDNLAYALIGTLTSGGDDYAFSYGDGVGGNSFPDTNSFIYEGYLGTGFAAVQITAPKTGPFQVLDSSDQISNHPFIAATDIDLIPTSAVPEPAAWLMTITGLGLMGAALRRRRHLGQTAFG